MNNSKYTTALQFGYQLLPFMTMRIVGTCAYLHIIVCKRVGRDKLNVGEKLSTEPDMLIHISITSSKRIQGN